MMAHADPASGQGGGSINVKFWPKERGCVCGGDAVNVLMSDKIGEGRHHLPYIWHILYILETI
jgi:hypothetical protein